MAQLNDIVADVVRRERGRILGGLARLCGSLDLAEEAFQESVLAALETWSRDVPDNPGAWLMTVAKNRAKDALRHRAITDAKALLLKGEEAVETIDVIADDYLRLVFTCCHPDLPVDSQIALTLKIVCGFSTEQIARAFVTSPDTVSQRILRAQKTIEEKRLVLATPDRNEFLERSSAVLGVIHSIFNEAHLVEAIRLAKTVSDFLPGEPEAFGLLAMMFFQAARANTRFDDASVPILLEAQDRTRWDRRLIREGLMALQRARTLRGGGAYVLQAEIAARHVIAPHWESTDWQTIVSLYDQLLAVTRTPIVALNRAIAVSMCGHVERAFAELRELEKPLSDYHLFYATRASLLERLGRDPRPDLQRALERATNAGDRRLLEGRLVRARSPRRSM